MAGQYTRLLDSRVLTAGSAVMDLGEVPDLGAYRVLEVNIRVLKAGTAGSIVLQHAATKDPSSFLALTSTATGLDTVSNGFVEVGAYLRFVRWSATSVAGDPVVLIDLVAKE